MKPLRKIISSTRERLGPRKGVRFEDKLECGHIIKCSWFSDKRRRCEQCLTDDSKTAWSRKTSALRPAKAEATGVDVGGPQ